MLGSYSTHKTTPVDFIFVPHFRGNFSWLGIGSNTNIAIFVPLKVLEAGVIPGGNLEKDYAI